MDLDAPFSDSLGDALWVTSLELVCKKETIVDEVLQVFRHLNLSHELVLVMVHACKGTNVCKDILKGVQEL
jgi:hypothetical protein